MAKLFSKVGRRATHSIAGNIGVLAFLVLLGVFMVIPFVYAVAQSLKPPEELFVFPPKFFVRNPTPDNYINLFMRTNNMWVPFERYIFNSIYMTLISTIASVIFAAMAAFPLAKFRFPGSVLYSKIITVSLLFVYEVTYIPQYILLSKLGLIDNPLAIILPSIASTLGLFLMQQFMSQIPDALIEAATGGWIIYLQNLLVGDYAKRQTGLDYSVYLILSGNLEPGYFILYFYRAVQELASHFSSDLCF